MMEDRKGFVNTLEAVLASTIFLIFIINVLPAFTTSFPEGDNTVKKIGHVLETSDKSGGLRALVMDRDVSAIKEDLEEYITDDISVGISYIDEYEGEYSGEDESYEFDVNLSRMRKVSLVLWVEQDNGLIVEVNGVPVGDLSTGLNEIDVTQQVQNGVNTLSFQDSGELEYLLESYNYVLSDPLPDQEVRGVGYPVSGNDNGINVSEVSVFIW